MWLLFLFRACRVQALLRPVVISCARLVDIAWKIQLAIQVVIVHCAVANGIRFAALTVSPTPTLAVYATSLAVTTRVFLSSTKASAVSQ